jgi:hypothetical protein
MVARQWLVRRVVVWKIRYGIGLWWWDNHTTFLTKNDDDDDLIQLIFLIEATPPIPSRHC